MFVSLVVVLVGWVFHVIVCFVWWLMWLLAVISMVDIACFEWLIKLLHQR